MTSYLVRKYNRFKDGTPGYGNFILEQVRRCFIGIHPIFNIMPILILGMTEPFVQETF
jgi:hypothetical protein